MMSLESLFQQLSKIAQERQDTIIGQSHFRCLCNADSWNEICLMNTPQGSRFFVCPSCDPKKECTICNQTGHKIFLETQVIVDNDGHKTEITIQNTQPNACICMNVHKAAAFLNNAEIPERYIKAQFYSFKTSHLNVQQAKQLERNIEKIKQFCEKQTNKYFVTLFGPVGSGKTLLATSALKTLICQYQIAGKFVDFQYLLSLIRYQYENKRAGEHLLDTFRSAEVLVIDEFAKGRMDKEWPFEKLDDLINYRYNNKKLTILTTNYLPFDYKYSSTENHSIHETFWTQTLSERIGERMYDRLVEVSEFVDFTSLPSYRRFMARNFLESNS